MKKQIIPIEMPIRTHLEGLDKVVDKLQEGLREGTTSIDLTKGMGKSFSKLIDSFKRDYSTFIKLTEGGGIDFSRSAEGIKAGKNLIKTFEELQRIMGDISSKSTIDLKKMFPEAFDSRLNDFRDSLKGLLDNLDKLNQKKLTKSDLEDEISNLTAQVEGLKKELVGEAELKIKTDTLAAAEKTVETLGKQVEALREGLSKDMTLRLAADDKEYTKIKKELEEIEQREKRRTDFTGGKGTGRTLRYKGKTQKDWEDWQGDGRERTGALTAIQNLQKDEKRREQLQKRKVAIEQEQGKLLGFQRQGESADWSRVAEALGKSNTEVSQAIALQQQYTEATKKSADAATDLSNAEAYNAKTQKAIDTATEQIDSKTKRVNDLTAAIQNLSQKTDLSTLKQQMETLIPDLSPELLKTQDGLDKIITKLAEMDDESAEKLIQNLQEMGLRAEKTAQDLEGVREGVEDVGEGAKAIKRANDEMENLKNSVLQFFSLTNAVQLFKQTVQSALNTVKELDATMTEAAVVTDFSIGDMWDQLPRYSKEAQKLGVSINGMYQATTLYYQQGLKTNEAMELGVETMKMAKIAAMDSSQATTAMTSALRGFNMELNETSATRVNDVYSQLAAVTAADTNQIATAMEKTASIASSANMEFETTAAFLAQIIETTQEAPETAGTALKTIIARFSEVKSLKEQGLVSGEDSEGEIIDVNKIQTALRSVGISMDEYFAGTEGLDDVLLKLAEKWGALDFKTQRYIATMAAGSRQQSRFIAMMSDYSRTQELVSAANNSAGASQKQFEKTTESLESSLTKLKNAWDQFTMGLANNEILKFGIDLLTGLLETVNKVTDAISGDNGLAKSIVSLFAVIGALKGGKALLGGITTKVGDVFSTNSYKETVTEEVSEDGKTTVKTIIKEPYKQGEEVGREAGRGFLAGFQQGAEGFKEGKGVFGKTGGFFSGMFKEKVDVKKPVIEYDKEAFKKQIQTDLFNMDEARGPSGKKRKWTREEKSKRAELESIRKSLDEESASVENLTKKYEGLGGEVSEANGILVKSEKIATELKTTADSVASGIASIGTVAIAAGTAISALGEHISESNEDLGEFVSGAGQFVAIGGSIATMAPSVVKGVKAFKKLDAAQQATIGKATSWAIVITLVVTAIAAIGNAIKKANEAKSLDKQLEKVNQRIEGLNEILTESSSKLEDLVNSRKELDKMEDSFNGLTKGTKEWQKQLFESNSEVLELIDKYPELAKYITKGEHGQLQITEEGWAAAEERAYQQQAAAQNAITAAQIDKNELLIKQEFEEQLKESDEKALKNIQTQRANKDPDNQKAVLGAYTGGGAATGATAGAIIGTLVAPGLGTLIGTGVGAAAGALFGLAQGFGTMLGMNMADEEAAEKKATGGLTQEEFSAFAAAAVEQNLSMATAGQDKEGFRQLYESMGYDPEKFQDVWEAMEKMGTGFDELAGQALALKEANNQLIRSSAENAMSQTSIAKNSEMYSAIVERQVDLNQDYDDQVVEKAKEYDISKDKDYDKEESKEVIKKYADLTGQTTDEVRAALKNESLSPETIANALAAADINGEMADSMDNMAKVFEKNTRAMTELQKRTLSGLIGKDTKTVYLNELGSYANKNTALATLQAQGVTDADAKVLGYESLADYAQALADEAFRQSRLILDATGKTGMHNELQGIRQQLEGMGIQITSQQALGFNEILDKVNLSGGSAQEFARIIPNLLQGVDQNQIGAALDIISSSSVATTGDIDVMVDSLRLLGANIDDNLIQKLYDVSDALKTVDFSQLENQLQNLGKATDLLSQKMEQNQRTFSTEEKTALVEAGVEFDLFVRTGIDEWSTLTDINSLLTIIDSKIGEILFEIRGNLEENVQRGQKIASVGKFYEDSDGDDNADKTISGLVLLEEIYSGKRDLYGEGSDLNISSENLKQLATQMGLDVFGKTDKQILEMVKTQYEQYYGIGGAILYDNLKQLYNQGASANQLEASKAVGTKSFYHIVDSSQEAQSKEQQVLNENEVRMSFLFNEDEITEDDKQLYSQIAESEQILASDGGRYHQYNISPSSVLKNMIEDPDFYSKWNGNEAMLSIMQDVGQILGLSGVEELDFGSLYTAILQVHKSGQLAEETLTALVNGTAGAGSMIDITTQHLKEQGSVLAKDEVLIKNLVIATTRQNKKLADFGKTLQSSNEVLEEGAWGTERYSAALENIALSLEQVTGIKVTDIGFLDKNRKLLLEIQKGGEGAAEAYKQLMWNYLAFSQGVEASELIGSELGQIITQALNEAAANGGTIDLTSYVNQIAALEDQNAESAKNALGIWFSMMSNADGSSFAGTLNDWSSILGTAKSSQQKWENPYDVFYNTSQKINQSLREREKLERQYQRLIDRGEATAEKLLENQKKQVAELQEEAYLQNDIIAGRKEQMNKYVAQKGLKQYAWVDENGNVQINWKAINAVTDQEKGSEIEEYISQLEEWSDSLHEAEDRLEEIEDEVHEINEQGKDEYLDLEQTVADALKESYQSQINKLSEINESINDTNSKLIESMQAAIDKERQARENEKTEEDIADKQQQLAYLQQDTSGANALEILKLQEEIDQAQEDYTNTLIDQKISDLQKQNEKAAEQRERQIQIAQDQLDQWIESGEHWSTVEELIKQGTSATENLIEGSSLDQLLKSAAGFEGMSHVEKMDWLEGTNTQVGQALAWLNNNGNHILDLLSGTGNSEVGNYTFPDDGLTSITDMTSAPGYTDNPERVKRVQNILANAGYYSGPVDGIYGQKTASGLMGYWYDTRGTNLKEQDIDDAFYAVWAENYGSFSNQGYKGTGQYNSGRLFGDEPGVIYDKDNDSESKKGYGRQIDANGVLWLIDSQKKIVKNFNGQTAKLGFVLRTRGERDYQAFAVNSYKTGGLADYTGPAWLDGTKSKPELVLNARDTQNFIQLKDILSSIMSKPTKSAENSGDINYDIDINVETIQEQADLDMIANYIENKIVTSAGYRNNNLVRTRR